MNTPINQTQRSLTLALVVGFIVSLSMYAFLRSSLWDWQHRLLSKETFTVSSGDIESRPTFDSLVVLGYAVNHDEAVVTMPLASRLELPFRLICLNHVANRVVMTGGCSWSKADELPSEAQVMKQWFTARWNGASLPQEMIHQNDSLTPQSCSRPLPKILTENHSTSTFTNAVFTLDMLQREHPSVKRLLLVTNRFHQWRTYMTWKKAAQTSQFRDHGFSIDMAAFENDRFDDRVTQFDFWRELAAIVYYKFRGYI